MKKGSKKIPTLFPSLCIGDKVESNGNGWDCSYDWHKGVITDIRKDKFTIKRDDNVNGSGFNDGWEVAAMSTGSIKLISNPKHRLCAKCETTESTMVTDHTPYCEACAKRIPKCKHCGTRTKNKIGKLHVCAECQEDLYDRCGRCGHFHLQEDLVQGACPKCIILYYTPCTSCGTQVFKSYAPKHPVTKEIMCRECIEKTHYVCTSCGSWKDRAKLPPQNDVYGRPVCPNCTKKYFKPCVDCKKLCHNNEIVSIKEKTLCRACVNKYKPEVMKRRAQVKEIKQMEGILLCLKP